MEHENIKTLAYLTIKKDYFDPIMDPDLWDFNPDRKDDDEKFQFDKKDP